MTAPISVAARRHHAGRTFGLLSQLQREYGRPLTLEERIAVSRSWGDRAAYDKRVSKP